MKRGLLGSYLKKERKHPVSESLCVRHVAAQPARSSPLPRAELAAGASWEEPGRPAPLPPRSALCAPAAPGGGAAGAMRGRLPALGSLCGCPRPAVSAGRRRGSRRGAERGRAAAVPAAGGDGERRRWCGSPGRGKQPLRERRGERLARLLKI